MATPAATFLGAFQAADSSARDWQRLALAQQQQANAMAQQLVENKKAQQAQDFNQMLALMKREDDTSRFEQQNSRLWAAQNSQDILGNYNAVTGRMGAATSRYNQILDARRLQQQQQYNDDPLALPELGGSTGTSTTEPALPSIPSIDDPQGGPLFNFGGRTYGQDWGPATATVFGGQNDPEDNGLSAFGGPTGSGGREGVAIPAKVLQQTIGGTKSDWERAGAEVTLADGTKTVLPIADLGTAERIWERNQGPTLDLTPGAVGSLGGTVITDRNGRQTGVRLPSQIANVRVVPDFQQASGSAAAPSPPDLSVPDITAPSAGWNLDAIGLNVPVPSSAQADSAPLLPSASAVPTPPASFVGDDLTGQVSQQMTALRREAALLKMQEQQATNQARIYQSQVQRIRNPVNKAAYQARADEARAVALQSSVQAEEAQVQAQQLAKDEAEIRKGQQEIAKLASLTGVLPDADVAQIKELAANPLSTGYRETITKTLTDYDEVRKDQGLNYRSNGYATAERVALAGKRLEKNRKDMESFDKLQSLQASLAAAGDDPKVQKTIKGKIEDAKPGAERWQRLKGEFDAAVAADTRAEPNAEPAAAQTPATPAAPPADIFAEADKARSAQQSGMSPQELQAWTDAKNSVYRMFGNRQGVVQLIAREPAGEMTLAKLKRIFRNQLRNLEPEDGEDFAVAPGFVLPKNAGSLRDVADALAEDLFRERGAAVGSSTVPNSPGISEKGRKLIESVSKSSP